jgi:hypothetical protein
MAIGLITSIQKMRQESKKTHLGSVKDGSDLGGTKGKTHVSRVSGGDGVHSKTTGLVGSSGKSGLLIGLNSRAHLQPSLRKEGSNQFQLSR